MQNMTESELIGLVAAAALCALALAILAIRDFVCFSSFGWYRWVTGGVWHKKRLPSIVAGEFAWDRDIKCYHSEEKLLESRDYGQPLWAAFIPMCAWKRRLLGGSWWHVALWGPGAEGAPEIWVRWDSDVPPTPEQGGWPDRPAWRWRPGDAPAETWGPVKVSY